MRALIAFIVCLLVLPLGYGQEYKPKAGETVLKIEIEGRGNVYVKLYTTQAPLTTAHVTKLVKSGFYNTQRFHRVEKSPRPYLIQIGDPASKTGDINPAGKGGSGTKIDYEDSGIHHGEGAVGLARGLDKDDKGDSQFYITLAPAKFLDGKYTVFGQVASGMDVVKAVERGDRVLSITVING